jgi:transposase
MAMGRRSQHAQQSFWIATEQLRSPGHPFYEQLNGLLAEHRFDEFAEGLCQPFYARKLGRPSLAPGVYFRCMLIGYFEGLDSERGIAWRVADSLSLRSFLGLPHDAVSPDHSLISRTRRRIDLQTHQAMFTWVLKRLAERHVLSGKTVGIDATTLEANAAMRSIVRREDGQNYQQFLEDLAKASGIATPTREDLARLDRKRKKKTSNDDWQNPHDPDAKITKMKDGRTHLAHKAEHAVDLDSGAVVSVTIQDADCGDTTTWRQTYEEGCQNLNAVQEDPIAGKCIHPEPMAEVVADKGYHSGQVLVDHDEIGIRSYISEPDRGRRNWEDKHDQRDATYANRRRIRGRRGRRLMRRRGERVERSFAHCYDTGGMRRVHLRGHQNILKRVLVHVAGFNLGLVLRQILGAGTPRGLKRLAALIFSLLIAVWSMLRRSWPRIPLTGYDHRPPESPKYPWIQFLIQRLSATGC